MISQQLAYKTALFIMCLSLGTCKTRSSTSSSPSTAKNGSSASVELTKEEEKLINDYKTEVEVGRSMAGRLLAFYGPYEDKGLKTYLNQVGLYVASYSDFPNRKFMFAILKSDTVNAFACPGGYILITLGAIRQAQSEAQLAFVLGHEIAHVGKQHMMNTINQLSKKELDEVDKKKDAQAAGMTAYDEGRKRPRPDEKSVFGEKLAKFLGSSGNIGMSLVKAAKAGLNVVLQKGLDQSLEMEADQEGTRYALRAGYDPKSLQDYLIRLKNSKKNAKKTEVLDKTHPPLDKRIIKVQNVVEQMEMQNAVGALGMARFISFHDRLPPIRKTEE